MKGGRVAVLTGAGCSTESGIPDYRGPQTGRPPRNPIQHAAFLRSPFVRRRYWARSCLGWPRFASAEPNLAHRALATMEARNLLTGVITQNVDGLHQAAGSRRVVELHGSLGRVKCLSCGERFDRRVVQAQLLRDNPGWMTELIAVAPDGDAEIPEDALDGFSVPSCACGGDLMPHVVFFGGHVEPTVLDEAWNVLAEADALLVVGSSLTVFSGYRFVRRAAEQRKPVAILNQGATRGDDLATLRIDAQAGPTLAALVANAASAA